MDLGLGQGRSETEVYQFDDTVFSDHHVIIFDIAMRNA